MISENLSILNRELPSGVKLVAVSKYHPLEAIEVAWEAGQRCFAESRPQEFLAKVEAMNEWLESRGETQRPEWHYIGHLQTNKLKMVLPHVSLIHSVDSVHLLEEINKWCIENGRVVDVLLEMHISSEDSKQGFVEEDLLDFLFNYSEKRDKFKGVRIRGLMGMATNTEDQSTIDADFERIDSFMAYLVDLFPELTDFNQLSIGMSGDWKLAVKHGATMVRIGSAIFA